MTAALYRTLALCLLLAPLLVRAELYRVEALIFLNPPGAEAGTAPQGPENPRALALDDSNGLYAAGIQLQADSKSVLSAEWANLRASKNHQPLLRLAWTQSDPPASGGPALRIYEPSGDGVGGLEGWLRLSANRYPHLEADLEWVRAVDGLPLAHRLRERRKLGSAGLHYLDSARLGLLVRVTKLPPAGTATPVATP